MNWLELGFTGSPPQVLVIWLSAPVAGVLAFETFRFRTLVHLITLHSIFTGCRFFFSLSRWWCLVAIENRGHWCSFNCEWYNVDSTALLTLVQASDCKMWNWKRKNEFYEKCCQFAPVTLSCAASFILVHLAVANKMGVFASNLLRMCVRLWDLREYLTVFSQFFAHLSFVLIFGRLFQTDGYRPVVHEKHILMHYAGRWVMQDGNGFVPNPTSDPYLNTDHLLSLRVPNFCDKLLLVLQFSIWLSSFRTSICVYK